MGENKQLFLNFIAMAVAFLANAAINFVLSGYIVNTVSEEAYGFIQLANTFITYFTIITIAINSMASRFISIEYYKNNIKDANDYYLSTLFANFILILVSLPIMILMIFNLENFIQISSNLVTDVKFLFAFLIGNLFLGLITTNLSVSYYIKNKLYIQSLINVLSYILKVIILLLLYKFFPPYVAIFGLATLLVTAAVQTINIYYKNKLIPEIRIKNGSINFKKIRIIVSSGIWNSVTRIGNVLSEGLDLLLANIFLSPTAMGILAIVKTIPNMVGSALNSLVSIFMPNMTKLYAEGKKEEFIYSVKKAMKLVGIFLNIPILCIIVLGNVLFKLWFPGQDSTLLQILSIVTVSQWIIIGPVSIMHNIFTVINKIKINSILICITGLINIVLVYILLKTTNLGLFAITGVSCLFSIVRNLLYTLPFGAKYIGTKWYTFFPEMFKSIIAIIISSIIGIGIKIFFNPNSWIEMIFVVGILCIIGLIVNILIIFSRNERKILFSKCISILKKYKKVVKIVLIISIVLAIASAPFFIYKIVQNYRVRNIEKIDIIKVEENINTALQKQQIVNNSKFAHISIDDFILAFKDITENDYNSIFENNTFKELKRLHDLYGVVITCYSFYSDSKGFDLSKCTSKFKNEFSENADWLKFAFHSNDGLRDYGYLPSFVIENDYNKVNKELLRITGTYESIDKIIRLQGYYGNKENIIKIKENQFGIMGLLSAEDKRKNYYLDNNQNSYLYEYDYYYEDNINFFKTDIRLEKIKDVDISFNELIEDEKNNEIIIIFTHEWELYQKENKVINNLDKLCEKIKNSGYVFDYPMNRIR